MAFCPHCGASVNPGASFCNACGHALVAAGPTTPGQVAAAVMAQPPRVRPVGVTIIGIVMIVAGAFAAIAAIAVFLFLGALGAAFAGSFMPFGIGAGVGGVLSAVALIAMMFVIAFAAFAIATGLGVMRGAAWAWVATLIIMGLNALNGLGELARRSFGGVLTLAVSGLVIWYFFQPDVKRWFNKA